MSAPLFNRRLLLAAVPGLFCTTAGCPKAPKPGQLKKYLPSVAFDTVDVKHIDFDKADLNFIFQVDNPLPLKVGLASLTYKLSLEAVEFLTGRDPDGFQLRPEAKSPLSIPLTLRWQKAVELLQATRGKDQLGFGLAGDLGFQSPIGPLELPYRASGNVPALRRPTFDLKGIRLRDVRLAEDVARVALDIGIRNHGGSVIGIRKFQYRLKLADQRVAQGETPDLGAAVAGEETAVALPIDIRLSSLAAGVVETITQRGNIHAGLAADLEVGTPFGNIPLAIDESGRLAIG